MRIAILRCQNLPSFVTWEIPNVEELFADDYLLLEAFQQRGVDASLVVWRDPAVDWSSFDLALIRSTWDYVDDLDGFLSTLAVIESSGCALHNPLATIQWNSNKEYLLDLQDWGVATVPTFRASTMDSQGWTDLFEQRGWSGAVVKPIVGTGGADVQRVAVKEIDAALEAATAKNPGREFLVQPLIESVISEGEWSVFFFGGEISHVLLKKPAEGDYRAHGIYGGTTAHAEASPGDIAQANAIYRALPFDLLYARLDLVRVDGRLAVMEAELIEPILYFRLAPESVEKLVDATLAVSGRQGPSPTKSE